LTTTISNAQGPIYWSSLTSSGRLPATRTRNQHPYCRLDGYAASDLMTVKQSTPAAELFRIPLEQLLVDAGYVGIDDCVADSSRRAAPPNPLPLLRLPATAESRQHYPVI
jgi:hypothetical protein